MRRALFTLSVSSATGHCGCSASLPGGYNPDDYIRYAYNPTGTIYGIEQRDHEVIGFGYDHLNRLTDVDPPGSEPTATYTYDNLGRRLEADIAGHAIDMAYDALGRLTGSTEGGLGTTSYQYDLAGRRTRMDYPGSTSLYLTYDYLVTGEAVHIRENGATSGIGVLATYAYDDLGRRTSLTRGNGTSVGYSYNAASQLQQLAEALPGTSHDLTLDFGYNRAAQITSLNRSNDTYAYTARVNGAVADAINGLNQIASQNGGGAFSYDARGNLTFDRVLGYSYDTANRMTGVSNGAAMGYDALGRLYALQSPSAVVTYLLNSGDNEIAELSSTAAIQRRFVHGPGVDELLVWYEGAGLSDRRWLHADEHGSIIAISDDSGAVTNVNSYDEYGVPASGNVGRFQYAGRSWLPDAGLYYNRARMYHPGLGRFMQTDPIGYAGGMNLYAYVGGDPVNLSDPSGLTAYEPGIFVYGRCRGAGCDPLPGDQLGTIAGNGPAPGTGQPGGNGNGDGQRDELGPCDPQPTDTFDDARTATIMGSRATANANQQSGHPRQEFHAQIDPNGSRYSFSLRAGPTGGLVPSVGLSALPTSRGSTHFHPSSSFGRPDYLSDGDIPAYREIFARNADENPNLQNELYIGLVARDQIYLWEPGQDLASRGRHIGPARCR